MSEHHSGPAELGAPMNYVEHERTYDRFLGVTKYSTMMLVILLIAMAAGFFGGAGLLGGLAIFIFLNVAGFIILR